MVTRATATVISMKTLKLVRTVGVTLEGRAMISA